MARALEQMTSRCRDLARPVPLPDEAPFVGLAHDDAIDSTIKAASASFKAMAVMSS